jgi:NADH-ubiquinone oxidoreductase chain 4
MIVLSLLIIPFLGVFFIVSGIYKIFNFKNIDEQKLIKFTGLFFSILNLIISFIIFIIFDFSSNEFQFVQEYYKINNFDIYLGIDGLSIYFVLLTTIIMPISLLSN